jgi:hypothetical protein
MHTYTYAKWLPGGGCGFGEPRPSICPYMGIMNWSRTSSNSKCKLISKSQIARTFWFVCPFLLVYFYLVLLSNYDWNVCSINYSNGIFKMWPESWFCKFFINLCESRIIGQRASDSLLDIYEVDLRPYLSTRVSCNIVKTDLLIRKHL